MQIYQLLHLLRCFSPIGICCDFEQGLWGDRSSILLDLVAVDDGRSMLKQLINYDIKVWHFFSSLLDMFDIPLFCLEHN